LNDVALGKLLAKTYEQHRLFNGTFEHSMSVNNDVVVLRSILDKSFSKILASLTPQGASIFGALSGMTFLPCPPGAFMKLHSLVNTVSMNLSVVSHVVLMFKDMLVWSDLEQDQTRILYQVWCEFFVRKLTTEPKFSFGVHDPNKNDSPINTPTVFIGNEPNMEQKGLVVLQGFGVSCLLLIEPSAIFDRAFYKQLFDLVSPVLKESAAIMAKTLESTENDEFLYLYFNSMNLALKSTIKQRGIELPKETMSTLLDMHETFERAGTYQGDVIVKTAAENWIIGKRSESRLLFVLIDQRNKTILDIADDVQAVCAKAFKGVFTE
jgi:hypothetical protein